VANPVAAILSVALMLDFLGLATEATTVGQAVRAAVRERHVTADIGGALGTRETGDHIARLVRQQRA
jgi:3-isopropylmalate dehydrogenase